MGFKIQDADSKYDEEGRKIFRKLKSSSSIFNPRAQYGKSSSGKAGKKKVYNNLDPIWVHPKTGAKVYVGNYVAASSMKILENHNIRAVVNCQANSSENYFENSKNENGVPIVRYHRFNAARLAVRASRLTDQLQSSENKIAGNIPVFDGFAATLSFIDAQLAFGSSVLIHCLAGAHRAGTTGVAYLMCKKHLSVDEAIKEAKESRSVISPFDNLLNMLNKLEEELKNTRLYAEEMNNCNETETSIKQIVEEKDSLAAF